MLSRNNLLYFQCMLLSSLESPRLFHPYHLPSHSPTYTYSYLNLKFLSFRCIFLIIYYSYLCVYTHECVYGCTWHGVHEETGEQLSGVGSLLQPPCGCQGMNSGHQALWQVLKSAESSFWPKLKGLD